MNRDQILQSILDNPIYEAVLVKYLPKTQDRDEFRQFLWVILCEIKTETIETVWAQNKFLYYYVGIINNQLKSSTSKWYKDFRLYEKKSETYSFSKDDRVDDTINKIEIDDNNHIKNKKLRLIDNAINHHLQRDPHLKLEFDLFKMKYNDNLTLRQISDKTKIPLTSVFQYIKNAEILIKTNIEYKKQKIR